MATSQQFSLTLFRLWARRHDPASADCPAALDAVRRLAADQRAYLGTRSLAWRLLVDTHAARALPLPDEPCLAPCRSAAASASHSAQLLAETIGEALTGYHADDRILVLGDFAFGWSLFGQWDLLPARGVLLVDLDEAVERPSFGTARADEGVRWGAPGRLRDVMNGHTTTAQLNGHSLLLPPPELILVRTAPAVGRRDPAAMFLFMAAARICLSRRSWPQVQDLAGLLGLRDELQQAVVECHLHHTLDLKLSPMTRARVWFSSMNRRVAVS